jgi:hypothetical protein
VVIGPPHLQEMKPYRDRIRRSMKWWKQIAPSAAVVIPGVGSFFAYRAIAERRDLRETLLWMDQTDNPHEGSDNFGQGHRWEIHSARKAT